MMRPFLLAALLLAAASAQAQTDSAVLARLDTLEAQVAEARQRAKHSRYMPQLHGLVRGKYEYQPDADASRFEVRNARISVQGALPLRSEYKIEVDLCDEGSIKMKDAWVRLTPWRTLRVSLGQQRLPFSIDAHRNPAAQYFANRSFIAKQVGDMRDVGVQLGYTFATAEGRTVLAVDAGMFNGSNLDNEKLAWHGDINYSARVQWFPCRGVAIVPSVQHTAIADHAAHYTSLDIGAWWEPGAWHVEAEYLHKRYSAGAFQPCNAVDAMAIYRQRLGGRQHIFEALSWLLRYDYMGDHSDGKKGFVPDADGHPTTRLALSDAERHRLTAGLTLHVANKWCPTDVRLNYEKYWYTHGGAKESEQDKLVAEIAIRF